MLEDLLKNENLGSYKEITFVINVINTSKIKSKNDIVDYCLQNPSYHRLPIQGILDLLLFIGFIKIDRTNIKLTKKANFANALELAWKKKIISEQDYHKIHIVRDLRNYVHLHKELEERREINEYWARTFSDICESIIKRFKK